MENLLQRLKPELKARIEQDLDKYPAMIGELIQELTKNVYMNDVKYAHIIDLDNYYLLTFGSFPKNAWECLID